MSSKQDLLQSLSHRMPSMQDHAAPVPKRRLGLWLVSLSVAAGAGLLARDGLSYAKDVDPAPRSLPGPAASAGFKAAPASTLEAAGFVTARRTATISARTMGVVQAILVDEGDRVVKNQVLAKLDDTRARIDATQAAASAELSAIRVRQAEVTLAESARVLERQRELVNARFASPAVLSAAETDYSIKRVALESARQEREVTKLELARYELLLAEYVIRAPFSGVVLARNAQEGETIAPTSAGGGFTRTGICTIADIESLEIEVDITEQMIDRVAPKQAVRAIASGGGAQAFTGEVIKLEPAADRAKATVKVRIRIHEAQARLLPGMSVRVSFL